MRTIFHLIILKTWFLGLSVAGAVGLMSSVSAQAPSGLSMDELRRLLADSQATQTNTEPSDGDVESTPVFEGFETPNLDEEGTGDTGEAESEEDADGGELIAVPEEYKLIPGDVLEVRVMGEPELDAKTKLNKRGEASLVLLGGVRLAGLTIEKAKERVREAYMVDYLYDPEVSVMVTEFGKSNFAVLGEVQQPGYYFFAGNEEIDLLQALSMAGGLTRLGSPKKVSVKRIVKGEPKVLNLNAKEMASGDAEVFVIQSGDIINVGKSVF